MILVRKRTIFSVRWEQISKCPHLSRLISMAQNTKPECSNYPTCSKKNSNEENQILEFAPFSAFLGQTNPQTPLDSRERLFMLNAPEADRPPAFPKHSFFTLQCRYLLAVPDPCRHHPTALKVFSSSMCSCFPREREVFWRRNQSQKEVLWLAIKLPPFRVSKAYCVYSLQTC